MCCELWILLNTLVSDVDGLLCQPRLVTARGIAALVGVGSVSWIVDHETINTAVSNAQCFPRAQSGLPWSNPPRTFVITKSLLCDCMLQPVMVWSTHFWSVSVRCIYICVSCSKCRAQCFVRVDVVLPN